MPQAEIGEECMKGVIRNLKARFILDNEYWYLWSTHQHILGFQIQMCYRRSRTVHEHQGLADLPTDVKLLFVGQL